MTHVRQWELETKLLYSVIVAGKSAVFADAKIKLLLQHVEKGEMPFEMLRRLMFLSPSKIEAVLREIKVGNYGKINKAFSLIALADLDLEKCTPIDLEKIHGIGPKTSRFFIMWVRPEEKYAALDVHVLRWLNNIGIKAPKSTPSKTEYARLEKNFLEEAQKRGKTPRELDLEIWETNRRKNNIPERK